MVKEIWKDVINYEGLYQVNNFGQVRSLPKKTKGGTRLLKPSVDAWGYLRVCLTKNGISKKVFVHRLVAEAFIPNPDNLPEVNHKSEIKTDNSVENLEYCSRVYNNNYGKRNEKVKEKLSIAVRQMTIDGKTIKIYSSITDTGKDGFTPSHISKCCQKKYGFKTHKGFRWEYA